MEYQALYRKWRPAKFEDVYGQDHVTATLKNQIRLGKIGHAYLFTGTRGTGKTTCAKILAKAVNCLNPRDGEPCGECENCRLFEQESLYDVVEIDAASKSRVEDIRSIIEEVVYSPSIGKRKVYIIDEVQMMTNNAFNALLKTLEEPPEYVVFILATTEAQKIPATILSRCQRFDFKRLPISVITSRLDRVASQENIELDADAAEMIALLADGAMRDALSILEQCQTAGRVTRQTVLDTVGIADAKEMLALIRACAKQDMKEAIEILDGFYATSKRMDTLLGELIGCYRDLLLMRMGTADCVRRGRDEREEFQALSATMDEEYMFFCIDQLTEAIAGATKNSGNLTIAQMCVLRLCRPQVQAASAAAPVPITKPVAEKPIMPPKEEVKPAVVAEPEVKADAPQPIPSGDFYKKFLAQIKMPNVRFCIPQSGRYQNGELFMEATAKSEYDFAVRPETQKHLRAACEALGVPNCVIHVVPPKGMPQETVQKTDSFTL